MLLIKILLTTLSVLAIVYAFIGALFAARNEAPIDAPILKRYKRIAKYGTIFFIVSLLLIIFF